ncbi:hypothetical protein P153DRAFT_412673 [Dothidotthia symphoricarpi CBS 119687]|uniref:Uncharacterized protein n=1 Tax=Dothidotthia symphoricarpi CBS 119687 TaxID=1392245 RepID=A0A6A5ZVT4_9PLEO|nr:uncharacterized protein P153DRAFT_412673 [Dothidotthia symphoricarpi CBS 119687]KAF2123639.1 hypothetical protein P153DRAFT_412673 [Dothidotthia symphoricarpi CBS 119687]
MAQWKSRTTTTRGVDTSFQDQGSLYQFNAHIVARPALAAPAPGKVTFLTGSQFPAQAREIEYLFMGHGHIVEYRTLEQVSAAGIDILALLDLDQPFLNDAMIEGFESFVEIVHKLGFSSFLRVAIGQSSRHQARAMRSPSAWPEPPASNWAPPQGRWVETFRFVGKAALAERTHEVPAQTRAERRPDQHSKIPLDYPSARGWLGPRTRR